tara:strand:+ start:379 stop:630 length:252 start_codon:yes stop_codon:yes gene_type:complete
MAKFYIIWKIDNGPYLQNEKVIETDATSMEELMTSGSLIPFFHSLEPRHTGSGEYSGSIEIEYDEDGNILQEYFKGETYYLKT